MGINTLNLETMPLDEVSKAVSKSAGFVIGSPTLGGHMPTQVALCKTVLFSHALFSAAPAYFHLSSYFGPLALEGDHMTYLNVACATEETLAHTLSAATSFTSLPDVEARFQDVHDE